MMKAVLGDHWDNLEATHMPYGQRICLWKSLKTHHAGLNLKVEHQRLNHSHSHGHQLGSNLISIITSFSVVSVISAHQSPQILCMYIF